MKIINKLDDMTPNLYTEAYVNELKEEITTKDKELLQLKQRIDKAIEYINEQQSFVYGIRENGEFVWKDTETKKDLLQILKGEDK